MPNDRHAERCARVEPGVCLAELGHCCACKGNLSWPLWIVGRDGFVMAVKCKPIWKWLSGSRLRARTDHITMSLWLPAKTNVCSGTEARKILIYWCLAFKINTGRIPQVKKFVINIKNHPWLVLPSGEKLTLGLLDIILELVSFRAYPAFTHFCNFS
jgi:hypothetical protein